MSTHTPATIKAALATFIRSGSANGDEAMRRTCLKLIPQFAQAPAMLKFIEFIAAGDCYSTHFKQQPCGLCQTCKARAVLDAVQGGKP